MNNDKTYNDALGWAKILHKDLLEVLQKGRIANALIDPYLLLERLEEGFPELKKSEDERIRKSMIQWFNIYKEGNPLTICDIEINSWIAYLEKLKEFQFGYPGTYFYDGEKLHFQGNPAMEEKQKEPNPSTPIEQQPAEKQDYSGLTKPAKWSEEDEEALGDLMWCIEQARKFAKDENDMGNIWSAEHWLKNRIKSLRPQPKEEREPMEIKYGGKICQVHGMRALPGGATGYIIEDEPGHYDCIMNPEEVLGGGYGVKQNGSPYPTKDATFNETHWKPSEEQMEWLKSAVRLSTDKPTIHGTIVSLYESLKRL